MSLIKRKLHTRVSLKSKVKVIDAERPLYFRVTDDQVYGGQRRSKNNCVLACALRDKIPSAVTVEVGTAITKIRFPRRIIRYRTPSLFAKQLKKWDKTGKWILPLGEYKLSPIPPTLKLGSRKGKGRGPHVTYIKRRQIPGTNVHTNHPTRWVTIAT